MDNKILKAWQESKEEFEKEFKPLGLVQIDNPLTEKLTSFLTAYTAKLLKAAYAGAEEKNLTVSINGSGWTTNVYNEGWNDCLSACKAPILEAIEKLEGRVEK